MCEVLEAVHKEHQRSLHVMIIPVNYIQNDWSTVGKFLLFEFGKVVTIF